MEQLVGIPVMLEVRGRRCVVVGGGKVAMRRTKTLVDAGARVDVVAPDVLPELASLASAVHQKPCEPGDLDGAFLVVVATNDPDINQAMAEHAHASGAIVNRADEPEAGDLTFMASHRDGPLTISVHTGGASANAAARLRDAMAEQIDPDWARLLRLARPMRAKVQQAIDDPDARTAVLRRLTDDQAMQLLKTRGESALQAYYAGIIPDSV